MGFWLGFVSKQTKPPLFPKVAQYICPEEIGILFGQSVSVYNKVDVFIATTTEVYQYRLALFLFGQFNGISNRMGTFQRRDNPFETAQLVECVDSFLVVSINIVYTAFVVQQAMFGSNTRII